MAVRLSRKQLQYFKDLEENFDEHVEEYKRRKLQEYAGGAENDLRKELKNHERYLRGCRNMEIDDVVINVRFYAAKIDVLRALLASRGR